MTDSATKKRIGIALCIIFASCLINTFLSATTVELTDSIMITARQTWGMLFDATTIVALLYIAFNQKINSNGFVKVGAILLILLSAIFIANSLSLVTEKKYLIEFDESSYLIYDIISIASIVIFYWSVKTWLPIKIAVTCQIIPSIMVDIAYRKLFNYNAAYETYNDNVRSYVDTVDMAHTMFIVIYTCALLATIVWLFMKGSKRVPEPEKSVTTETKPGEIISKIPHK